MENSPKIELKGDLDHIRLRPGMYIGNTYTPDHLLQEIFDNSTDELLNDFANEISISFIAPDHVVITDDGRGIPDHEIIDENGNILNSIIVACTKSKSGGKFNIQNYKISTGLHGFGLTAVNALCKYMRVSVKDKLNSNRIHDIVFDYGNVKSDQFIECDVNWNTRIEFIIDPQYFTIGYLNKEQFIENIQLIKARFPAKKFIIDDAEIQSVDMMNCIRDIIGVGEQLPIYSFKVEDPNIKINTYITYDIDGLSTSIVKGDVNLRRCGGTYKTNFTTLLSNTIVSEYKNLNKTESLSHLRAYIDILISEPSFDSQSKNNMTKDLTHQMAPMKNHILNIIKNISFFKQVFEEIQARKSMKRASKKINKTLKKRVSAENPLKDCLQTPGDILYIMEGESAVGTLNSFRDKKVEAILPITGKILNVIKSTVDKALDSKKFKYLLESLGIEYGKKQTNFRFKQVKILCDADPDGMHIAVLVLFGLWKYAPSLIEQRKVSIIIPPLYGVIKKNTFIPIYDHEQLPLYQGYNIQRYKGIGEMDPNQLEFIIKHNPIEYVVNPPGNNTELDAIIRCITDTEVKRQLCIDHSNFNITRLFSAK